MKGRPLYLILGIILLVVILIQWTCNKPKGSTGENEEVISEKWDTVRLAGDPVPYPVHTEIPVPYPVYNDTGSTKWLEREIDTLAVLREYFKHYEYIDTISNDSTMLVIVTDTIGENKLQGRGVQFQALRGNTLITGVKKVETKRVKFFIGLNVQGDANRLGLGPSGGLLTKRDKLITLGNDLMGEQPNAQLTLFWKVSFRKKQK